MIATSLTRRGTPRKTGHGQPVNVRLLNASVVTPSGCWEWTHARVRPDSYGVISIEGRLSYAHRISYETFVGPIPAGMTIDHLCGNRGCINPLHLEVTTTGENTRRAIRIGHDHPNAPRPCSREHDWSVTPPYVSRRADGSVQRKCRACTLERLSANRK